MARYLAPTKQIRMYKLGQSRLFSNKLFEQHSLTEEIGHQEIEENDRTVTTPSIRYNVCRERCSSGTQKFQFPKSPNVDHQLNKMEDNLNLMDNNTKFDNPSDEALLTQPGYRQFEASSTYKNLVLPLKASKLSDPFPSPVKMMPSHTVSDQEKAEQMMAERRIPRSITKKK